MDHLTLAPHEGHQLDIRTEGDIVHLDCYTCSATLVSQTRTYISTQLSDRPFVNSP